MSAAPSETPRVNEAEIELEIQTGDDMDQLLAKGVIEKATWLIMAVPSEFARELERESAALRERIAELERAVLAGCPRMCGDFCNSYQQDRELWKARGERDRLREAVQALCDWQDGVPTNGELELLMDHARAALKEPR